METKTFTTKKKLVIEYREDGEAVVEKRCTKCLEWRVIDLFPTLKGAFYNKNNHCNNCEANRAAATRRLKGVPVKKPHTVIQKLDDIILDYQTKSSGWKRMCNKCYARTKDDELSTKPISEFHRNVHGYLGYESECKECKRRRGELYRRNKGIRPQRKVPILMDDLGTPTHRECSRCQKMLPLNQYAKHNGGTAYLGVHPYCKECSCERHLISTYGITSAEKAQMHKNQNEACAICLEKVLLSEIHVDHCHSTGKIRGLLCSACNKAAGFLKDDPEICLSMARYLNSSLSCLQK